MRLAASAARFCALLAIPVLACAWLAAGWPGLVGAGIAALLVTALLTIQAIVLAACARRGGAALMVGVYVGFVARLAATAAVLTALRPLSGIDMPNLVIAMIVLMIAVLVYESWHVCHTPAFFWVDPRPAQARGRKPHERTLA